MSDQPQNNGQVETDVDKEVADALGDFSVMDLMDADEPVTSGKPVKDLTTDPTATTTRGKIVAIHDDDVFVDIGGKSQGILPLNQFEKAPEIGQEMEFVIEGLLGDEGLIKLSRQGAITKATWDSLERGMVIEAKVTGTNTGGLELKVAGQRAFMPASQVDIEHVENLNQFLNQKLRCKVQDLDRRRKNIILSRRAVLEEEKAESAKQVMEELAEGQTREGTVRNIQKFGAFVDLGGIDGLIHISDLSYQHIDDPTQVVKVGQQVRVKVLKVDRENDRISLGLKQIEPDPWETAQQDYPEGEQVSGRVTKLTNFGAFVELAPGIEGLIPLGEMSYSRINRAEDVLSKDQVVNVMVLNCDPQRRRISLSLKQLKDDPWKTADSSYMPGTQVSGQVTRTTTFGAFVLLEPGVEGMIHISELAHERVPTVESKVNTGDEVTAEVLSVDPDQRRIALSIKALTEAPEPRGGKGDGGRGRPRGKASRDDMRKYVVKDAKEARAGESLGSLLNKFGQGGGDLKGGLG
jgi:small subunit ribosomal protein S1